MKKKNLFLLVKRNLHILFFVFFILTSIDGFFFLKNVENLFILVMIYPEREQKIEPNSIFLKKNNSKSKFLKYKMISVLENFLSFFKMKKKM